MISYDQGTLRLLGIPVFSLVLASVFVAALAGLAFGIFRWRRRTGKVVAIASGLVLLLYAVAVLLVLITVGSGSMG